MGLDVYLYKYDNHDDDKRREKQYEDETAPFWTEELQKEFDEQSPEELALAKAEQAAIDAREPHQALPHRLAERETDPWSKLYYAVTLKRREAARARAKERERAVGERLGLHSNWESDAELSNAGWKIEIDSKVHPDHMFKIGYFRSSYNDGGLNTIMRQTIGSDLHDIFTPPKDGYEFLPDWVSALEKAKMARDDFAGASREFPFRATRVHASSFRDDSPRVVDTESAMVAFRKELDGWKTQMSSYFEQEKGLEEATESGVAVEVEKKRYRPFGSYSNAWGTFFLGGDDEDGKPSDMNVRGIEICGAISGTTFGREPCVYLIYKTSELDWYKEALDVVVETCEWVLAQDDPSKFYLAWSG